MRSTSDCSARIDGAHAERLRQEATDLRQPFGGARQHLNAQLARRRASQLEHVHLAKLFARMGYAAAAEREANVVPTASARMMCQMDCLLTAGHQSLQKRRVGASRRAAPGNRSTSCTAPSTAGRSSIRGTCSVSTPISVSFPRRRTASTTIAWTSCCGLHGATSSACTPAFGAKRPRWTTRSCAGASPPSFATWPNGGGSTRSTKCRSVEAVDPLDAHRAAQHVAEALNLWHKGGAATGNIGFWAPHAERFDSPQAYSLVIDAVLDRATTWRPWPCSCIGWARRRKSASKKPIARSTGWPNAGSARRSGSRSVGSLASRVPRLPRSQRRRILERAALRSGAAGLGRRRGRGVPRPGAARRRRGRRPVRVAAYEEMVYIDSTADGREGSIFDEGEGSDDELDRESRRIAERAGVSPGTGPHVGPGGAVGRAPYLDEKEPKPDEKQRRLDSLAALGQPGRKEPPRAVGVAANDRPARAVAPVGRSRLDGRVRPAAAH